MKIIYLMVLIALTSCSVRPKRYFGIKPEGGTKPEGTTDQLPQEVESNEPIDSYLSIGPYLQKEFDKADNAGKIVKVYVLMRQENSVTLNFDNLKASILPVNPSISTAIETAQKAGISTVEFEVDVAALKTALALIPKAVSSIELSLGSMPQ